jgi:hypothetical protein
MGIYARVMGIYVRVTEIYVRVTEIYVRVMGIYERVQGIYERAQRIYERQWKHMHRNKNIHPTNHNYTHQCNMHTRNEFSNTPKEKSKLTRKTPIQGTILIKETHQHLVGPHTINHTQTQ